MYVCEINVYLMYVYKICIPLGGSKETISSLFPDF